MGGGTADGRPRRPPAQAGHLVGTVLRARPLEEKIAVTQRFAREVLPLFDAGAVRPVIDRRFPLDEIAEAHGTWRPTPTSARS